ncbi:LysR family transcriptional regulator [Denitrobaculum tricleocarpae]|uniref:LysR family transcriptional regulator n=1 Tax=Denitrobaculum tricleocarpae TaxID=2591009 RepID=A0A545U122_9PROT|nr:LysR family transcriptional regulator [Denitrobaculum tricleocarpae]TQV83103.1 LysR family transcriptional regulator [Denitrobaculum tricleocarpae]
MNNKLDWNDYRVALQIADAGSLSKAAQQAGSSHPTMFRRINAVEEKLGVRLFERFRSGYRPTAAGEEVVAVARRIAELTNETERRMAGRDLRPTGLVRVATTDSLMFALLAPEIARLRQSEPGVTLEFIVSNEISNLSLREADIAIRPVSTPDPHLIGRKLGVIRQAIYAQRGFDAGKRDKKQLQSLPWLGPSPSMAYSQLQAWMKKRGYDQACVCTMDSVLGLYAAVRAGMGLSVLPTYLAEPDEGLERLGAHVNEVAVDLWLLTHPDLRSTARVRAVLDHLGGSGLIKARLDD